ncbi:MAG: thiolase domain-containing protein [Candidatus Heimdallarchaeum endolithica]|uniref:Thiolase domain-containing protein n=1 Tax=Candidatus Heimdallarchaeum endolithica TaxID=2876572 RepID=A0A9Y1FR30_9ARCH|nr:MAG: thiolase domain-containing protein [Candidatus Heimdallarchaeum endolithica]
MSNEVYIIGTGQTKFGEFFDLNIGDLASEAVSKAIKNAGIGKNEIRTLFIGSTVSNSLSQSSIGGICTRSCSLSSNAYRIESGNASGAAAFHHAFLSIKSGLYDVVVVLGIDKLSDYVQNGTIEKILASSIDYQWEYEMGATLTGLYSFLTQAHMEKYGTTLEQLAYIPTKNHQNGVLNPKAQYRYAIPIEKFLNAKRIADPIGRFDIATPCDGAAAIILASERYIENKKTHSYKVKILSSSVGSDTLALQHREKLTELKATKIAANDAYHKAKLTASDINLAEVHDSHPIGEILAIEDLGLVPKGEGGKASVEGLTALNGKITVNPSGGLKARGDPFGATGIAQLIEIVEQIRGNAGKRQVNDVQYGLTQNVMGTGVMSYVSILGRGEN